MVFINAVQKKGITNNSYYYLSSILTIIYVLVLNNNPWSFIIYCQCSLMCSQAKQK